MNYITTSNSYIFLHFSQQTNLKTGPSKHSLVYIHLTSNTRLGLNCSMAPEWHNYKPHVNTLYLHLYMTLSWKKMNNQDNPFTNYDLHKTVNYEDTIIQLYIKVTVSLSGPISLSCG